jgi:lysozyme
MNDPIKPQSVGSSLAVKGVGAALLLAAPIVMYFEGLPDKVGKLNPAYYDNLPSVALITACYGHTDPSLKITDRFTDEQCKDLLLEDLTEANAGVNACIKAPLNVHQRAALISFTYNVGRGKLCSSTLAKKANAGQPFCAELSKWVYAGGKVRNGLVKRRAAERKLCEAN